MSNRLEKISIMILNYLRKNPEAGDTLEGITRWWLEAEKIEISVDEVTYALEILLQKGQVQRHKSGGGNTFYKIKE